MTDRRVEEMGEIQELFHEAEKYYEDSVRTITTIASIYRRNNGGAYSVEMALREFDVILQAILFTEALSDGRFHRREMMFLDILAKNGDLLREISDATGGELQMTWYGIAALDTETQLKLTGILPGILERTTKSFVTAMASVDKEAESIDVLRDLTTNIGHICACLGAFDGAPVKKESRAAGSMMSALLYKRWKEILDT